MLVPAMEEVIIPLPAESRVFPGKSTDDALLYAIPIHSPKKVFQAGDARPFISIDDPESFIPATEKGALFPDFIREEMGMSINDHWSRFVEFMGSPRASAPWGNAGVLNNREKYGRNAYTPTIPSSRSLRS
jgi:hypothetical protein